MQKVGMLSESQGRCYEYALLRYFQMYPKMYLEREVHSVWVIRTSDLQNARAIYFFRGWAEQTGFRSGSENFTIFLREYPEAPDCRPPHLSTSTFSPPPESSLGEG